MFKRLMVPKPAIKAKIHPKRTMTTLQWLIQNNITLTANTPRAPLFAN